MASIGIDAEFFMIDMPAIIILLLASISCAILGNFLILKNQALMIDAISHSILPGIVMAAVLSGTLHIAYIMTGAIGAALFAVFLSHGLHHWGRIERNAAIGAVFTTMFALGVVLLETALGSRVHLDTQHVLYGALELSYWARPFEWDSMPPQILTLFVMCVLTLGFTVVCFKEWRITIFDPVFASALGYRVRLLELCLFVLCALVAVSCFEAMGSILVIALFTCPAATARLLTNRMEAQVKLSVLVAIFCVVMGYICASFLPLLFGFSHTLNNAAAIAVVLGLCLFAAIVRWVAYNPPEYDNNS